ncbi:hypothetical protein [Thermasporomyces composti]|uniref:Excreted virulence factor EspC (Type VII ESX diderm) n=1 Tax=Thermasporomyces composti TaxID=696763 RepID=A0A3D9V973_THECX|nr:hypothetical protein [Thermasporomyces composti]REF38039.1 hypothetical protein DFJ64_3508 [Thermasporomyces composti]
MSGGDRRITRDLIRNIGDQIAANTREPLQKALDQAREAQKVQIANYTAVEHTYAGAYIAAVEFVTQDWDTKISDAQDVQSAIRHLADNWNEAEQKSTLKTD